MSAEEPSGSGSGDGTPSPVADRLPGILLAVVAAACQPLLGRLTEVSWEATALIVVLVGPWAILLIVDPHPSRTARRRVTAVTVASLVVAAGVWGLVTFEESAEGGCSSEYKGACVPLDVPDVDCSELRVHGFRSVGSDPYGLDSNGDGIACE